MKGTTSYILMNSTYGKMKADTLISITRSEWDTNFLVALGRTRNKKTVKRVANSNVVFRFAKGIYSSCNTKKLN